MLQKNSFRASSKILFLLALTGCNGGGSVPVGVIDDIAPTVLANPVIRPLNDSTKITLSFSESMDTATLLLSGDLATDANGGIWSSVKDTDDTLIISPNANWTTGTGRTLTVDAKDLAGNGITRLTLSYDIYNSSIFFVSAMAIDDNDDGLTPDSAKQSITKAIDLAVSPAVILVNVGTYNVSSDASGTQTHIILKEGVSLYGGYNNSFTQRNTTRFTSIITDNSSYITANNSSPNRTVEAGLGITPATVIDGFTLNGSSQAGADYTAAMLVHSGGKPTIENNIINGGSGSQFSHGLVNIESSAANIYANIINGGSGNNQSRAIDNEGSTPLIRGNTIDGGTGGSAYAVLCRSNSDAVISENVINGGNGVALSYGVYSSDSAPTVNSNTINGGSSSATYAIYNDYSSSPLISKNSIHGGSGFTASYGVYNILSSAEVFNNNIYGGSSSNASYGIANGSATTVIHNNNIDGGGAMNAYGIIFNSNAVSIDNNIIFTSGGTSVAYCLFEENASGDPASVRNNNLYGCATALYLDYGTSTNCATGATCITSITNVNILNDTTTSGNISTDSILEDIDGADDDISTMQDNDWHFSDLSPGVLTFGGLNGVDDGGWGFTDDMDSTTRPTSGNPWSIGAYEP